MTALSDQEHQARWGFADSAFVFDKNGVVTMTGRRYNISSHSLPAIRPWLEENFAVRFSPEDSLPGGYPPQIAPGRLTKEQTQALIATVGQANVITDPDLRLRASHGHSVDDIWLINYAGAVTFPVVDVVVTPVDEGQIVTLVTLAQKLGLRLHPFGGGTNVSQALGSEAGDPRPVVCVHMRNMAGLLSIDRINMRVTVQAGMVGRHLAAILDAEDLTCGHEPDSIEFSTVGGWIATRASGMKKNAYGNIEDLLLGVRWVSARGVYARDFLNPRESVQMDDKALILGSEGRLGIITEATLRLFAKPAVKRYQSVVFPDVEAGYAFIHELERSGQKPASVRLADPIQFQISQVLKPEDNRPHKKLVRALQKFLLFEIKRFTLARLCACTLVCEGDHATVRRQYAVLKQLARRHKGLLGGAGNARLGYMLTFSIAYIRDFLLQHGILGESFETSIDWDKALPMCRAVEAAVQDYHRKMQKDQNVQGKAVITWRITQLYASGVTVYFYLGVVGRNVAAPLALFHGYEDAARQAILAHGGALSHHHGVGRLRQKYLPRAAAAVKLLVDRQIKDCLDPERIFLANSSERKAPPS